LHLDQEHLITARAAVLPAPGTSPHFSPGDGYGHAFTGIDLRPMKKTLHQTNI
jgi:hypothetical protein